ncbi:mitochondrial matrix Mmp37-domain-containing protein [Coniella lustricola]|uniref:Phosphatidate cytidylyltransferase, mitochondrial n=1 Tax=Coniella lustricola TaxID=2025994 RepID=A0A2T3A1B1_9PEZI|nr:mitochondrial matrix Mmp37-domain-containing protein [Coniella lustricola]
MALRLPTRCAAVQPILSQRPYQHQYYRLQAIPAANRLFNSTRYMQDDSNRQGSYRENPTKSSLPANDAVSATKDNPAATGKTVEAEHKQRVPGEAKDRPETTASSKFYSSSDSSSSSLDDIGHDWEDHPHSSIKNFSELPFSNFGVNQHIKINDEFKEALRTIPWQFRAPIRYAFAYGSGVFPQSKPSGRVASAEEIARVHPKVPPAVQRAQDGTPKMIDFIFGVTFTQHWHSLNLNQHRDHYSGLGSLGSAAVSYVQDRMGAGVYFNTHVVVNGILIKYGVVNIDTLCRDLTDWDTLYLAGRLHKPVKILRDDARVRFANQKNLISALRTALLLLPEKFTEHELYNTVAGISYLGDPRMTLPTENPNKVLNIVGNNITNFHRLYNPLIENLPNVSYEGSKKGDNLRLVQDMDPVRRGNMVRRLPKSFRSKLYFQYQRKFAIPQVEFDAMMNTDRDSDSMSSASQRSSMAVSGVEGGFETRIAQDDPAELRNHVRKVIKNTIGWPSTTQSLKGLLTGGVKKSFGYVREKIEKYRAGSQKTTAAASKPSTSSEQAGNVSADGDKTTTKSSEEKKN